MRARLDAVVQSDDVRMAERLEYLDLSVEVFLQFLVEPREFDGLDGYGGARDLERIAGQPDAFPS